MRILSKLSAVLVLLILSNGLNAKPYRTDAELVDFVSSKLTTDGLFLITDGDYQPTNFGDGNRTFNFQPQSCEGIKQCKGLLLNLSSTTRDACMKPSMKYRMDELPTKLIDGQTGIFTVTTITEPLASNRDFFIFYHNGSCIEFDWGYNGSHYKKAVELANQIIGM